MSEEELISMTSPQRTRLIIQASVRRSTVLTGGGRMGEGQRGPAPLGPPPPSSVSPSPLPSSARAQSRRVHQLISSFLPDNLFDSIASRAVASQSAVCDGISPPSCRWATSSPMSASAALISSTAAVVAAMLRSSPLPRLPCSQPRWAPSSTSTEKVSPSSPPREILSMKKT